MALRRKRFESPTREIVLTEGGPPQPFTGLQYVLFNPLGALANLPFFIRKFNGPIGQKLTVVCWDFNKVAKKPIKDAERASVVHGELKVQKKKLDENEETHEPLVEPESDIPHSRSPGPTPWCRRDIGDRLGPRQG